MFKERLETTSPAEIHKRMFHDDAKYETNIYLCTRKPFCSIASHKKHHNSLVLFKIAGTSEGNCCSKAKDTNLIPSQNPFTNRTVENMRDMSLLERKDFQQFSA